VKGLTLWQPWASLVALGAKQYETRSWGTTYRGWLAIHAARHWTAEQRTLCAAEPYRTALAAEYPRGCEELPRGAILAVVRLVACGPAEALLAELGAGEIGAQELAFGTWGQGRYAWALRDWRRLPQPIPWRGLQGLWTAERELVAQIEVQVGPF
jgi:activating signal cointegrator 1